MGLNEGGAPGLERRNLCSQAFKFLHVRDGAVAFGPARHLHLKEGPGRLEDLAGGISGGTAGSEFLHGGVAASARGGHLLIDGFRGERPPASIEASLVLLMHGQSGLKFGHRCDSSVTVAQKRDSRGAGSKGSGAQGCLRRRSVRLGPPDDCQFGLPVAKFGQFCNGLNAAWCEDDVEVAFGRQKGLPGSLLRLEQLVLDPTVNLGAKEFLEDILAGGRVCGEELTELALRKDDDLAELVRRNAEELHDLLVDIANPAAVGSDDRAIRSDLPQGGCRADGHKCTASSLWRTALGRRALDPVALCPPPGTEFELELHFSQAARLGMLAAKVGSRTLVTGADAKEGEADGIQDGRLA